MEDKRDELVKEIAAKVDVEMSLEYLIKVYNEKYPKYNFTNDDFGIRLARTPEEACYRFTIITCPKSMQKDSYEEIVNKGTVYDIALSKFNKMFGQQKDYMTIMANLTWEQLLAKVTA